MKHIDVKLNDVQQVYTGPVKDLWELIMGEQIHIGGFSSSHELASKAGIKQGMKGVDLCCCTGAGMRFLNRFFGATVTGVDATDRVVGEGRQRIEKEGFSGKLDIVKGDVTNVPLQSGGYDFVWGEDAWCYVGDKEKLISEAARLLKSGGIVAFTDWVEGPKGLAEDEATRINSFMKFPYIESISGYKKLLEKHGFEVIEATDLTSEFASCCDLYIDMLTKQLTYDALKIINWDMDLFKAMGGEMDYMRCKAHEGKMGKARFIARKK